MNNGYNIAGFPIEPNTPEMIEKRKFLAERKRIIFEVLGVDLLVFDSKEDSKKDTVFENIEEEIQYHNDVMLLGILADKGAPIPGDLAERLSKIKRKREQLQKKKK